MKINRMATENWLNMTNSMTDKEIKKLKKDILEAISKDSKFIKPTSIRKMGEQEYEVKVKCPYCKEIIEYKNCFIKNKFTYGFNLVCRNCHMRFFVVSFIQKIAYANYSRTRALRDLYLNVRNYFKKKELQDCNNLQDYKLQKIGVDSYS